MMRFEVYNSNSISGLFGGSSTQGWRWRLRSGNGEIMASGEGYATKYNAERACLTMKAQIADAPIIETKG